jgi:hypothetical protein
MTFAEHARALLSRHGGAPRATELRQRLDHLQTLRVERRRTSQRIGASDRAWFFSDTPDEEREEQYEEAIETAEAEYQQALTAWCSAMESAAADYPPLEVVYRTAHAIHEARADREVGRETKASEAMADRLEAIGERLLALWAPDVSIAELCGWLADDTARRGAAAVDPGPLQSHATLGWAPMDARELSIRVARALEASPTFHQAQITLQREKYEFAQIAEQLRIAQEAVTWGDKLVPGKSQEQQVVAQLEQHETRETLEVVSALERHHLEIARAFAVHPVMWLHLALLGAAACLRALPPRDEQVLGGDGELRKMRARTGRAALFACLVEVRRAADHAFAGVFAMVWPRRDQPATLLDSERGPYRQRGAVAAEPEVPRERHPDEDFYAVLEKAQLRAVMGRVVTAATMIALLDRGRTGKDETVAWTDRLAFWSSNDAEVDRDALRDRTQRLQQMLRGDIQLARSKAEQLATEHPALGLGVTLAQMRAAADEIHTPGGESSSPRSCPVINQAETQNAIARARAVLTRFHRVHGSRRSWVQDVMQRLAAAGPDVQEEPTPDGRISYQGIISRLAAHLRPTPFASLVARVGELTPQDAQAANMARSTKDAVPWLDVLNIFESSDAEQLRDQWKAYSKEVRDELRSCQGQMNQLLYAALATYPPLLLDSRLESASLAVGQVRARSQRRTRTHETKDSEGNVISRRTEVYYVCVIDGKSVAQRSVAIATEYATSRFAAFPTATQMLEQWVQQEL